jgi:hypothetical protein
LLSAAIERQHRLGLQPLAQGVAARQAAKLRQDLFVAPKLEVSLDPFLQRDQAQLLEALRLAAGELLVGQLAVRLPSPEAECALQQRGGQGRVSFPCGRPCPCQQALEAPGVDCIVVHLERVAGASRHDARARG